MLRFFIVILFFALHLSGCELVPKKEQALRGHIEKPTKTQTTSNTPEPVRLAPALPSPEPSKTESLHTVVVYDVPVSEVLFSLARDAKVNLDLNEDVNTKITLNAIKQPFPVILERIAEVANLRYDIHNNVLRIRKDWPFLRSYRVDYLNMQRKSVSNVSVATQISSTGQGAGAEAGGGGGSNNSTTSVQNSSDNEFWETLKNNIAAIISSNNRVTNEANKNATKKNNTDNKNKQDEGIADESATDVDAVAAPLPGAGAAEGDNPNIVFNRESGIVAVRATQKQHKEIQQFIDQVLESSHRQVLIEATIAEVSLSDKYQAGIDWTLLRDGVDDGVIVDIANSITDTPIKAPPTFSLRAAATLDDNVLDATLRALETFGDVKVMSSPKVMALNNQTALLKVVDNLIYFTVEVNVDSTPVAGGTANRLVTFETQVNTVPVGFVMSVTPYVSNDRSVSLNIRPTLSRVLKQVRDPNPELAKENVINEIPVIQVREVESMLRVNSGDIAVIGGLMQDEISKNKQGIPVLGRLPILGSLFRYDSNITNKTELVIFIKPVVIKRADVKEELKNYQQYLPTPELGSAARP
jgi:MSHA type pilus biogenesis protein MshL